MNHNKISPVSVSRVNSDGRTEQSDLLAVEEPLEVRLGYGPVDRRASLSLAVTMRTPGHDEELALGFLLSEGIIAGQHDLLRLRHCEDVPEEAQGNVIRAELSPDFPFDPGRFLRNFYTSSSCGVCGKASLDAVSAACPVADNRIQFAPDSAVVLGLESALRGHQSVFSATGGLHAAALFSASGKLIFVREDIGRHNALDKLIGAAMVQGLLPLANHFILLSGRIGFELVQKAVMAGAGALVAFGAPSSLAVSLAEKYQLTLIGFLRENRYNQYV
ncbi:MAG: formate dehydrogenase accessory sulfurtransferase FdhD [Bacteroidia bacterium]